MFGASELKKREVIDLKTAEKLGFVEDVEIDVETGLIQSVIVPKREGIFSFIRKKCEYVIPWQNIAAVGKDIILVRTDCLNPDNGEENTIYR